METNSMPRKLVLGFVVPTAPAIAETIRLTQALIMRPVKGDIGRLKVFPVFRVVALMSAAPEKSTLSG